MAVVAPAALPTATLRQRSLELLARSFAGEDSESRPCPAPPAKRPHEASASEGGGKRELLELRDELVSSREAGAESEAGHAQALRALGRLSRRQLTASELRTSELGRELNLRFWRDHPQAEVASRSRTLVARWRTVVASARLGGNKGETSRAAATPAKSASAGASKVEAPPDPAVEASGPKTWEAAWTEAGATHCAQALEAAAWRGLAAAAALGDAEHLRLYKGKVRFLASTLRRPENAELRQLALQGRLSGEYLASRGEEEFLPEARRAERQQHREEGLRSVCLQQQALDRFDADHVCPRCGKAGAKYTVVGDTGGVAIDSTSGVKRQKSKKRTLYQCVSCEERWQEDDGWHC